MVDEPPTIRLINGDKFFCKVDHDYKKNNGMLRIIEVRWDEKCQNYMPCRERIIPVTNILSIDTDC